MRVPARRRGQRQGLDLDGEAARVDSNKAAARRRRVAAGIGGPKLRDSPGQRLSKVLRLEDAIRAMGPHACYRGRPLLAPPLASPAFETKAIKKAFNAYSDNVYYEKGDSDRANLYLLGGTPPSSKQTIQYMPVSV